MNQSIISFPTFERQLANGLQVIVQPDTSAPGVAVNIWYRVGSADEVAGKTGFAHLFEHMMFQGSNNVASGEHFALLEQAGGIANATTSFDRTNYFATVPTGALELALWLEADRMAGLNVNQTNLDAQREVVKEEKRQSYDNRPYGDLLALLLRQHFPASNPYGHPTIGSMADLEAAQLADVQRFFAKWYLPNNAVMTICGNVTEASAFALAEHYFGAIPAGPEPAQRDSLTDRLAPNLVTHEADVPHDLLYLTWSVPPMTDPASEHIDLLANLLTDGLSARLHRRLVRDRQVAASVGAMQLGLARTNSIVAISARLDEGQTFERAEEAIYNELLSLAHDPPSAAELDRAKALAEREYLQAMAQVETRADLISGSAATFGDPRHVLGYLQRLATITEQDLVAAAGTWLQPQTCYRLRYQRTTA